MVRSGARSAANVSCPGCAKVFTLAHGLKRHLGAKLYGRYKKGLLTAAECAPRGPCKKILKGRTRVVRQSLRPRISRLVVLRRPAANIAVVCSGNAVPPILRGLEDVTSIEKDGVGAQTISDGVFVVQRIPCVASYVQGETAAKKRALYRFLLFVIYSLHATHCFMYRNLHFFESTLAIAIGDLGMSMLDNVRCFAAYSPTDVVLWDMIAHVLVRPGLIEHLRNDVCSKRTRPTRDGISRVMTALARRHGHVASRMPPGQRTWRQIDVFSIASTQTLGAKYCGSHQIYAQLLQYEKLESIARLVAAYSGQTVRFCDIVDAIGSARLVCYAPKG